MEKVDLSNLDETLKAPPETIMREAVYDIKTYVSHAQLLMNLLANNSISDEDLPKVKADFEQLTETIFLKLDVLAVFGKSLSSNQDDFE